MPLDPEIDKLLSSIRENRDGISKRIVKLDILEKEVQNLYPTTTDFRNRHVLEEKIKATTAFFDVILKHHQEFGRSVEREIEIRRRNDGGSVDNENIRDIITKLERQGFTIASKKDLNKDRAVEINKKKLKRREVRELIRLDEEKVANG